MLNKIIKLNQNSQGLNRNMLEVKKKKGVKMSDYKQFELCDSSFTKLL